MIKGVKLLTMCLPRDSTGRQRLFREIYLSLFKGMAIVVTWNTFAATQMRRSACDSYCNNLCPECQISGKTLPNISGG